jgi:predicted dehydrogenase
MNMADKIRWGILATGNITHKMVAGLQVLGDAEVAAVGSRSLASANAFADKYGIPRRHGSYEALCADPEVDVIYVAPPHSGHKDCTLMALKGGKAVLCEKPFAINRAEAEAMVALAREKKLFLMEAMWTRFLPSVVQARAWLKEGRIGDPQMVYADFGFRAEYAEESRLFDPAFGGGGLLDVGVYAVSFAAMVFGAAPNRIASLAEIGPTQVDDVNAAVLGYPGGGLALVSSAVRAETQQEARIVGTKGIIHLPSPFWCGTSAVLTVNGSEPETFALPYDGNGYNCQAREVMDCMRAGKLESDIMPLDETLAIMGTLDQMRAQWGLKYPME